MSDNIDASLRLAALQSAQVGHINATTFMIVERAKEFYAFLSGVGYVRVTLKPDEIETIDPLPLAGHPPIETGAALAADEAIKRKRRTKAEMEAARAAEDEAKDAEAEATRARVRAEVAKLDAVEAAKEATQATPAPAAVPPDPFTVADVKKALHAVVEKDGLGPVAGGKLLAQFGVKRVSELDEKIFAEFIAACNAAVAG